MILRQYFSLTLIFCLLRCTTQWMTSRWFMCAYDERTIPVKLKTKTIEPQPTVVPTNDFNPKMQGIKIAGNRWITIGDFIVHKEYGIGKFIGVEQVDITPAKSKRAIEPVLVIKYRDAEVTWFQRLVEKELWFYQSSGAKVELSSIADPRKWNRSIVNAEERGVVLASNLIKMTAIRNNLYRRPCPPDDARYASFEDAFVFEATVDQQRCFDEIRDDMVSRTRPMDRLICGDVGFGKTEVAMRAIYRAVLANKQVALLAPTRILALQHCRVLSERMPDVSVKLLRGGGSSDKNDLKGDIKSGACQVVVGTHALLQPTVEFGNLGLLVIDEEQRFGVAQKEKLKAASEGIDILTLSATPIPRTLQLASSGLKDLSLMTAAPKGRLEVKVSVGFGDDMVIMRAIKDEISRDGQVFVVVPFVRDIDPTKAKLLRLLPTLRVIEAHGQHDDLESRIEAFIARKGDVLLATTVIENGIDIPNCNTIIILEADRFGMSALYQLRGRVGRSTQQAYAYFMTNKTSLTLEAESRLLYVKTFTSLGSGYDLARRDLELRGYGTIFGKDQSGSKDIGMDLQALIIDEALAKLKENVVLPAEDCRVDLKLSLDLFALSKLGPLPKDAAGINTWETQLSLKILEQFFKDKEYSSISAERELSMLSSQKSFLQLSKKWTKLLGKIPPPLFELLMRNQLRMALRKCGCTEIIRSSPADAVLNFNSMTAAKWEAISSRLSKDFLSRLTFADNTLATDDESNKTRGVVKVTNIFVEGSNGMPLDLIKISLALMTKCESLLHDMLNKEE